MTISFLSQRLRRVCGGVVAACLGAAAPAVAQVHAGVTYGVVFPIFDPLVRELGGVNGAPVLYPVLEKWHTGGAAFTGRALFPLAGPLDLETAFTFSPTAVATRDSLNGVRDLRAQLMMASVRLPIVLSRRPSQTLVHVAPGIAYSWRSGSAWSGFGGLSAPAAILSAGMRGRANRRSAFWFYLSMEDYISKATLSRGNVTFTPQVHHLFTFNIGVLYQLK